MVFVSIFFFILAGMAEPVRADTAPVYYEYKVISKIPHSTDAYTQGLFFYSGDLFETTGQYGQSKLRRIKIATGAVAAEQELPDQIFGEGSVIHNGEIYVLSWREQYGMVFDPSSLKQKRSFQYFGEGWGLTSNGEHLVMSDGSSILKFIDPETFDILGSVDVTLRDRPVSALNELEWIDGEVYANVYQTNAIVRIDPASGKVTGVIDMRGILPDEDYVKGETDVLNGIAYDAESERLFVTGKNWPWIYEIELTPRLN